MDTDDCQILGNTLHAYSGNVYDASGYGCMIGYEDGPGPSDRVMEITVCHGIVSAVLQIAGVKEDNIVAEATVDTIRVAVDNGNKRLIEIPALPCEIDPESVVTTYNNGILEVTAHPLDGPKPRKRRRMN